MAKTKALPAFEPVPGSPRLSVLRKNNARMAALELSDGKICLISPLNGMQQVECPGKGVAHILAPNHYHNKGLAQFHSAHPRAQLCASNSARPRLEEQTGLKVRPLTALARKLPSGFSFLEPEGLKTGEVWIRFKAGRAIGWLVTDAFSGKTMTAKSDTGKTAELLRTFPSFGIADAGVYKDWVTEQIRQDKPGILIPCHGSIVSSASLPAQLNRLIKSL